MSLRKISISLASIVVLAAGLPAFAGDIATVQDNVQTNTVTGNGNRTSNNSTQISGSSQRGRGTGDAGTSQKNDQLNDVLGNGNRTSNNNTQVSGTYQRGSRR